MWTGRSSISNSAVAAREPFCLWDPRANATAAVTYEAIQVQAKYVELPARSATE